MADVIDPFEMGLFGGLPKTGICASEICIDDITVLENQSVRETSSLGLETRSSSAPTAAELPLHGGCHDIAKTARPALNAVYSEMKASTSRLSLSDRLTPSLISAGLVCGITPSSTRKQSGQPIQVLALNGPAGSDAEKRERDSSSSKSEGRS
jgi:hypothetical protein